MLTLHHIPDHEPDPAGIEARCRRLMAANAGVEVRGFDGERARLARLAEIDAALDEWNAGRR